MSIQANYVGGVERPFPVLLTTTGVTAIIVAENNSGIVAGFTIVNNSAAPVLAKCYYWDGTTQFDIYQTTIPANGAVIVTDLPLRLYSGDEFRVQAATANVLTVVPAILTTHQNAPVS